MTFERLQSYLQARFASDAGLQPITDEEVRDQVLRAHIIHGRGDLGADGTVASYALVCGIVNE